MDAAQLPRDVWLRQIRYNSDGKPRDNENSSKDFLLILPLTHGRVKLERDGQVLHDGAVQPGIIRIVRPGECSRLTPETVFESAMVGLPATSLEQVVRAQGMSMAAATSLLPSIMSTRYDVQRLVPLF